MTIIPNVAGPRTGKSNITHSKYILYIILIYILFFTFSLYPTNPNRAPLSSCLPVLCDFLWSRVEGENVKYAILLPCYPVQYIQYTQHINTY